MRRRRRDPICRVNRRIESGIDLCDRAGGGGCRRGPDGIVGHGEFSFAVAVAEAGYFLLLLIAILLLLMYFLRRRRILTRQSD